MLNDALFLPAAIIGFLGWLVPTLLSRVFAEGVKPLMWNAFTSVAVLWVISSVFFVWLYASQGTPLAELVSLGWFSNMAFFGRLGLVSAIIWAPIMVLTVATLPRHWKTKVW